MQEIFVQEKGAEALRTTNITYLHNQRREEPNMERKGVRLRNAGEIDEREYTQEEEDDHVEDNNNNKAPKKDTSKGKVKKSLKVDKEIKVTTTIVKQKSNSKKKKPAAVKAKASRSRSNSAAKAKVFVKVAPKKIEKHTASKVATPSKAKAATVIAAPPVAPSKPAHNKTTKVVDAPKTPKIVEAPKTPKKEAAKPVTPAPSVKKRD